MLMDFRLSRFPKAQAQGRSSVSDLLHKHSTIIQQILAVVWQKVNHIQQNLTQERIYHSERNDLTGLANAARTL